MNTTTALRKMMHGGRLNPLDMQLKAHNPESTNELVGAFVRVGYEIEGDTVSTAQVVRLLAPGAHVDIWEHQELAHADIYEEYATQNKLVLPDIEPSNPPRDILFVSKLAKAIPSVATLMRMVVDVEGYKNEHQNMSGIKRAAQRLANIGETGIAAAFMDIYRQETFHAAYYLADLNEIRTSHPVLYSVAKAISNRDPMPIGANTAERMERIGEVVATMFNEGEIERITGKVGSVLGLTPKQLMRITDGIQSCVTVYTEKPA